MGLKNNKSLVKIIGVIAVIVALIIIKSIYSQMPETKEEFMKSGEIAFKNDWDAWYKSVENTYDGKGIFGKQESDIKLAIYMAIGEMKIKERDEKLLNERKNTAIVFSDLKVKKITDTYSDITFKVTNNDSYFGTIESATFEIDMLDANRESIGTETVSLKNKLSLGLSQTLKVSTKKDVVSFKVSVVDSELSS